MINQGKKRKPQLPSLSYYWLCDCINHFSDVLMREGIWGEGAPSFLGFLFVLFTFMVSYSRIIGWTEIVQLILLHKRILYKRKSMGSSLDGQSGIFPLFLGT